MIAGRKCVLIAEGRTFEAEAIAASDNLESVMLSFGGTLRIGGGMCVGRIALLFDRDLYTYRDILTGVAVGIDWLCSKCNEHFNGREVFTLRGEMGVYVWDVEAARSLVASQQWNASSPNGAPQLVPTAMLTRLLEVNSELDAPEHLEHVDPAQPGIIAQRFGGVFLLDGTYRAHKGARLGIRFYAHVLTLAESESLLIREMTEHADVSPEVVARELRGVLKNNGNAEVLEAVVEVNEDPEQAERAVRAYLTADENARLKLTLHRCGA